MRFSRILPLLLMATGACAHVTNSDVRAANRTALNRLTVGMTKPQVLGAMGTATVQTYTDSDILTGSKDDKITNPYRTESYAAKGVRFEVLYYYTDVKASDGAITDDELTPIVLKDGSLDGWGWGYWQDLAQRYEIRLR